MRIEGCHVAIFGNLIIEKNVFLLIDQYHRRQLATMSRSKVAFGDDVDDKSGGTIVFKPDNNKSQKNNYSCLVVVLDNS